jgi:mannose-1-phosphate guanylyltransferase
MAASERRPPRALLLTAGLGTRLRPLSDVRAKAAIPVNGHSLVQRVIHWLAAADVRDLIVNLHHKPASITGDIGDGRALGVRVRYSWEQPVLGSAGGPRHALPLIADASDDPFLIVNGDTLTNLDLTGIVDRHRRSGALVTMALIPNPNPEKYGGVFVSEGGWVTGFGARAASAPSGATAPQGSGLGARGSGLGDSGLAVRSYHFIGVQVAEPRAFSGLEDGVPAESVNQLYRQLIAEDPRSIAAYVSEASFLDIGTPRDYLETSLALAETEGPYLIGTHAQIASSAVITRSALWDDVTVGSQARLHECVVADGVRIPEGASFTRCAIVPLGTRTPRADERVVDGLVVKDL